MEIKAYGDQHTGEKKSETPKISTVTKVETVECGTYED